ncbi:MAG TPA: HYR domain-containing protein, partial [Thermoanaerobaculia bacterium]
VMAIRPSVRISAALIAFGNAPLTDSAWTGVRGEAYWRVYQDWRAWTEEGIIDIAIPMNYKVEHIASNLVMFNEWNEWLKNHQYNRAGMIGMTGVTTLPNGNSVEGLLRQTRKALAPSSTGNKAAGVIYFSMANTNVAVTNNPFALPAPASTPLRTFAQFASGLTAGKSGTTLFEDPVLNPVPVFFQPALVPDFPWKSAPAKGHLMGFARLDDGTALDTAVVTVENVAGGARTTQSDGQGFYGSVDLSPGDYFVKAVLGSATLYGCVTNVVAGQVSSRNLAADNAGPVLQTSGVVVPADAGLCSAAATWTITGNDCLPFSVATTANGQLVNSGDRFPLGTTVVTATATDRAGNVSTSTFPVTVVDAEAPVITGVDTNRPSIWPPNHQMVNVRVNYTATDNCGTVTTTLTVTSDDAGEGTADGNTESDFEVVSNREVRVRAERSARGGDRIYTITITATDSSGNATTSSTNVVVPHDQR